MRESLGPTKPKISVHIDPRLRELLWSHSGYVLTHTQKTAGNSVRAALSGLPSFIKLRYATVSNLEVSMNLSNMFESALNQLRTAVTNGRPWILDVQHQSFGDQWHLDLPPTATVLITHRATAARLQSWIRYFFKIINWAEDASFEVLQDGTLRHCSTNETYPHYTGGAEWKSEHEWIGDPSNHEDFISLIQTKLMAPRIRQRLQNELSSVLTEHVNRGNFYYRDMFPIDFTSTEMFLDRTVVVPYSRLDEYFNQTFNLTLPRYNTSTDVNIEQVTNLDAEQLNEITDHFAQPDQGTEEILLRHAWSP